MSATPGQRSRAPSGTGPDALNARLAAAMARAGASPSRNPRTPTRGQPPLDGEATHARLLGVIRRLNRSLGLPEGRATEGVATASAQMLSKMVSRYEATRVSVQQTQRTIGRFAPDWDAFQGAYGELKGRLIEAGGEGGGCGGAHLDRYLTVVARVLADPDLASVLAHGSGSRAAASDAAAGGTPTRAMTPLREVLSNRENRFMSPAADRPRRASLKDKEPAADRPSAVLPPQSPYRRLRMDMDEIAASLSPAPRDDAAAAATPDPGPRSRLLERALAAAPAPPPSEGAAEEHAGFPMGAGVAAARAWEARERLMRRPLSQALRLSPHPPAPAGADPSAPRLPPWVHTHPVVFSGQTREALRGSALSSAVAATGASDAIDRSAGDSLGSLEPEMQELVLLDDLLYAFLGVRGRCVRARFVPTHPSAREEGGGGVGGVAQPAAGEVSFEIDARVDPSLASLASRMLPLCVSLQVMQTYVETRFEYGWGLVHHALCAIVKDLVWEWRVLVSQMEAKLKQGELSLPMLWYYVQPSVGVMHAVAQALATIVNEERRGAGVLDALQAQRLACRGDPAKHAALLRLLKAASRPYLAMLSRWLIDGQVDDPYDEFLVVVSDTEGGKDTRDAWGAAYAIRQRRKEGGRAGEGDVVDAPFFLSHADIQDKVLRTGKYLNAVRAEGGAEGKAEGLGWQMGWEGAEGKAEGAMEYDPEDDAVPALVSRRFAWASRCLLSHLHSSPCDMVGRLCSMKRYFLLDQSDFLVHFIDSAAEELDKDAKDLSVRRLQSLFELAVKTSSAAADPYNEDASCGVGALDLATLVHALPSSSSSSSGVDQAKGGGRRAGARGMAGADEQATDGLHLFRVEYRVGWPFSLVVGPRTLLKYQLIFSHLFQFKGAERKLSQVWQAQQSLVARREGPTPESLQQNLLCKEMMHWVHNYLRYMTMETIAPAWQRMERRVREAKTIDECIQTHEAFLNGAMDACGLLDAAPLRATRNAKAACLAYCAWGLREDKDPSHVAAIARDFHASLADLRTLGLSWVEPEP